jgi:hypothetical protein
MTADFTIYAGEDWPQTFQYVDASNNGINISTASEILFVADNGTTQIKKSKSVGGVSFKTDGTDGAFTVDVASTNTTGMGGKTFQYEIKLTISAEARVIYPAPGATATFDIDTSLTDGVTP